MITVCYEAGINHCGSLDMAKQLIDVAVSSGCQVVKFQKRNVSKVYSEEELAKPRPGPWGETNGDLKHLLEFGQEGYYEINKYCVAKGIQWTASCWDDDSVAFIADYKPPFLKVPSALITNLPLLACFANTKIPLVISTGMSTLEEVSNAIMTVQLAGGYIDHILACTSTYPCKTEELNLLQIRTYKAIWGFPIGYSSHSVSPWPMLGAVALGATFIEFHGTLDRTHWGTDQSASLEPGAAAKIVREIRDLEIALGDGKKVVYDSELPIRDKLRR